MDFNLPQTIKEKNTLVAFQHFKDIRIQSETTNINFEREQYENMRSTMNTEQLFLIDTLNAELADIKNKNTAKCYFIDAPGGTGKTYCLNAFIHHCLSLKSNIIVTSYAGVAALLLKNGRTAHSQFKFPLNQSMADCSLGTLKATEPLGKQLYWADVIFLDELTVMHKLLFELLHNRTFYTPFAGKLIIGAGDPRQCLPIKKYADRTTIVQSVVNRSYLWVHVNYSPSNF
jgi:ATP-dependent DNA helicase PIF1